MAPESKPEATNQRRTTAVSKNPDGVDDDDTAKTEAGGEDKDDAMIDDDQSSEEEESFRWRDAYKEYKSFPRQLKMYDTIWLCLFNAERKAVPKALSRAEARGTEFHIDGLDEEEIEAKIDSLEQDMKNIREAVRIEKIRLPGSSKRYGYGTHSRSGTSSTLYSLIDAAEERIEYNDGEIYNFPDVDEEVDSEMVD
jgi:hypothetical protein